MDKLLNDPMLWIIILVALVIVVALALWIGRGIRIRADKGGLEIEVKEPPSPKTDNPQQTVVAKNMKIGDGSQVGNIIGERTVSTEGASTRAGDVSVAEGAEMKNSKVGDIIGIDKSGGKG